MERAVFARFDSADQARAALDALGADHLLDGRYTAVVHDGGRLDPQPLTADETAARPIAERAVVIGLVGGLIAGALVGSTGVLDVNIGMSAVAGAALGSIIFGLSGLLGGATSPHPQLADLATHAKRGEVVVSVEVDGLTEREHVERTFDDFHAEHRRAT